MVTGFYSLYEMHSNHTSYFFLLCPDETVQHAIAHLQRDRDRDTEVETCSSGCSALHLQYYGHWLHPRKHTY